MSSISRLFNLLGVIVATALLIGTVAFADCGNDVNDCQHNNSCNTKCIADSFKCNGGCSQYGPPRGTMDGLRACQQNCDQILATCQNYCNSTFPQNGMLAPESSVRPVDFGK
jgi:hypothetical protein